MRGPGLATWCDGVRVRRRRCCALSTAILLLLVASSCGDDDDDLPVSFEDCGSSYLMTVDELDLFDLPDGSTTVCTVPTNGAVEERDLLDGESLPEDGSWVPVRHELCVGWAEASHLRCPDDGEVPDWAYLAVPYHNQLLETDAELWDPYTTCMAAALTMILDYDGLEDDMNEVIAALAAIPAEDGGYDPDCQDNPVCASAGAEVEVAQDYCSTVISGDDWTREAVLTSIDANEPVSVAIAPPPSSGHAVVIIGYKDGGDTIIYHDPWFLKWDDPVDPANDAVATWDDFAVIWLGPVDVGDPLQPEGHSYWGMTCEE